MPKTILDYRSGKPIWCSYCGNYSLLTGMYMALAGLDIEPKDLALVSGIGCSSRLPGFVKTYGFHSVHGRPLPIATGIKEANPALTTIVIAGDGDCLGIGGGHLLHAIRRNADITCIVVDNGLYGMTKGQPSPTTPFGVSTATTPYGNPDEPINLVLMAVALGASFVARGYAGGIEDLKATLTDAISHKGFSIVHVISPCPTFNTRETYKYYSKKVAGLPEGHNAEDMADAMTLAIDSESLYTGVFFRTYGRPTYEELLQSARERAGHGELSAMIERCR